MVTGGSPMGLGGGAYPILLLHIFVIIEFKLAGIEATTAINQQLTLYLQAVNLNLRSYIFFLHFKTSFLPLWMYIPFVVGLP